MNVKLFLLSLAFLCLGLTGTPLSANTFTHTPSTDTIPRIDYIGYRLYLTHFESVREKKGQLYIKLSAINTGNKKMILGRGAAQVFPVVKFDPSVHQANLTAYQNAIYFQLLEEKITIPIGAITTKIELKLPIIEGEASPVLAEAVVEEKGKGKKEKKKGSKKKNPTEEILPEESLTELMPPVAEEPVDELPSPNIAPAEEVVDVVENKVEKEMEEKEVIPTDPVVESETSLPQVLATSSEEKPSEVSPEITSATEPEPAMESSPPATVEEDLCADLVLQNVNIVKRNKNSVTLSYQLYNQGMGKAPLIIGKKKEQQSLAIRANLSSHEKLTRGSIVLGGTFLHGEELDLEAGGTYNGTLKVALHKLTKFTPVLVLELDAYEFISECNESNNISIIRLIDEVE